MIRISDPIEIEKVMLYWLHQKPTWPRPQNDGSSDRLPLAQIKQRSANLIHEAVAPISSSLNSEGVRNWGLANLDSGYRAAYAVVASTDIEYIELLDWLRSMIERALRYEHTAQPEGSATSHVKKRGQPRTPSRRKKKEQQNLSLFSNMEKPEFGAKLLNLGYCQELGMTYYDATMDLYRKHIASWIKAVGIERVEQHIDPFETFAKQVVEAGDRADEETKKRVRLAILQPEDPGDLPEHLRNADLHCQAYSQYASPAQAHM